MWKKCGPCMKDNFNNECYVTYINGLYSCEWEIQPEKKCRRGFFCCSLVEKLFYPVLVAGFCISVVLLLVWIETSNDYSGFDWVVFLGTGRRFFWSRLLLCLFGILFAYTLMLLVLGFLLIREGYELYLHWCHKIVVLVATGISIFLLAVLCIFWNERWHSFGLSLKVFAPYIHLSSITMLVLFAWPVAFYLIHFEQEAAQVAIGVPFFLILVCLFVVPWGIFSPCLQEKHNLGPKPGLFGHRGAPMVGLSIMYMLGPENTMMSFEKAVENGAFGLEADVFLSFDEVPFLMHDNHLKRTTNINEVMPNASYTEVSFFYWNFLSTLNAGKWFVDSWIKPFYDMKPLSKADKERARKEKIPKLSDLIKLAKKTKKYVIFDLRGPPPKHPLRNTYVRRVVDVILDTNIEQHLIYWLPDFERKYVKWKAPGFQQVGRLDTIEELTKANITIINVDYKKLFPKGLREYKEANVTINIYVVNEPWLFSLAWCSRVHSVTTDNIELLMKMDYPHYVMTPSFYKSMWLLLDCVSAVFIGAIFSFHWWRESQKEKAFESTSSFTDIENISLQSRKSEKQEALNVTLQPPSQAPDLTRSERQHPGSKREPEPVQETANPPMSTMDDTV